MLYSRTIRIYSCDYLVFILFFGLFSVNSHRSLDMFSQTILISATLWIQCKIANLSWVNLDW